MKKSIIIFFSILLVTILGVMYLFEYLQTWEIVLFFLLDSMLYAYIAKKKIGKKK